jgi:hypothetical protein
MPSLLPPQVLSLPLLKSRIAVRDGLRDVEQGGNLILGQRREVIGQPASSLWPNQQSSSDAHADPEAMCESSV